MTDQTPARPRPRRPPATGVSAAILARMAPARISQRDLSSALGMPASSLGDRLRGLTQWRVTELAGVAQVLGCDLAELLTSETLRSASTTATESTPDAEQPPASLAV